MLEIGRPSRRRFLGQTALGLLAMSIAPLPRAHADDAAPSNAGSSGSAPSDAGTSDARLADAAAPPKAITPQEALDRLLAGNARYAANKLDPRDFEAGRAARAKAQYPIASILGCADSRVSPELLFDQGPGDLFVVRVAGNYLNHDALASLEYGVAVLGTPLVIVLGHSQCGAIKAAVQEIQSPKPLPGHIWDITDAVRPGIEAVIRAGGENLVERAIDANIAYNASRIAAAQPLIAEAVKGGKVKVVGAEYALETGKVRLINR